MTQGKSSGLAPSSSPGAVVPVETVGWTTEECGSLEQAKAPDPAVGSLEIISGDTVQPGIRIRPEDLSISRPLLLHAAYVPWRWLCHTGHARAKCRDLAAVGAVDTAKACVGSLRIPEHQQGTKQRRRGWRRQGLRLLERTSLLWKLMAVIFAALLFCEFSVYYLVIFLCRWPEVAPPAHSGEQAPVLRAMVLADTHLLGEVQGHWLDKLRREWQMERAFQTALWVLQPEVIFILGDIFDEGKWSSPQAWADDLGRFQKMFRHPAHVQLKVVAGNHDVGFHYWMNSYTVQRFEKAFSAERLFSQKGVNFVMVNSVAMEGDGCSICAVAEAELLEISRLLNCSREVRGSGPCGTGQRLPPSAPILLQHYPLYRASDANCSGPDAALPEERSIPFKEKYDVLSQEASQKLLWWFRPRLVLSGHTHSACEVLHGGRTPELSVPSFSWRNRNNPSFVMASLTSQDYAVSKCFLPQEDTVLATYCGVAGLLAAYGLAHAGRWALPFLSGWTALGTHRAR